jgi:hypothetical protein
MIIDDFRFVDEFHLTMFVRVYTRLFKLTQHVRLVYLTGKPRLIPFQLQFLQALITLVIIYDDNHLLQFSILMKHSTLTFIYPAFIQ